MTDLYLKFANEDEANSVLYRIEGAVEADPENEIEAQEGYPVPNYRNIDTIGIITEGGEWNEEGEVIVEPTVLEGWHVNVRLLDGEDAENLQSYLITPSPPIRVWA